MESEEREGRWEHNGGQRTNVERSPGGSVKRARERAAAGLSLEDAPPIPNLTQSGSISPLRPSPRRSPRRSPQGTSSPVEQSPVSPAGPQRQPPQRPPRPNFVPPMLQNQQAQSPTDYWSEGHGTLSGYSSSSRPTTASTLSTASIPDFPPIPNMPLVPPLSFQPPPRRNLGPPPSARRGASSYYSQTSFVPPIPEELSPTRSSYASSDAVPESWGDGPPRYYMGAGIEEEEEEEDDDKSVRPSEDSSGRQSQASDYRDTANLVKGPPRTKPLQPFMETIESGDESASQSSSGRRGRRELDWQARQDERFRQGPVMTDPIGRHNFRGGGNLQHPYSGYASDATFLDSPRSTSPPVPKSRQLGTGSSKGSPIDPRVGAIMSNLEKGGALTVSSRATSPGLSTAPSIDEKASRRPPPLNLDSPNANKGPGRSSQSSLPELIRRATRLASNLDRGKTASRAGVLDMLNKKEMERMEKVEKDSREGSISDMLAAFPSPTPTASPGFSKPVGWGAASPHGKSNLSRAQTVTYGSSRSRQSHRRGRRCCGMPIWAFILLMIILLLLIAAAVVIPVTLVVIPRQNATSNPTVESCNKSNPCLNGGAPVVLDKQCRCICAGRHTGATCSQDPDSDCTTTSVPIQNSTSITSNFPDATFGLSIPRILTSAQGNFSIPLSGWRIAALFNYNNLTCTSENALVTFNSRSMKPKARRRRRQDQPHHTLNDLLSPRALLSSLFLTPSSDDPQEPLDATPVTHSSASKTLRARASAQSSNGIVFAPGAAPGEPGAPAAPAPASPSFASDPSSSNPSSSGTGSTLSTKPITPTILDFARTAVLFVFQETGDLGQATTAMTKLNVMLGGDDPPENATFEAGQQTLGGALTVDLGALTVGFGNGTLFGGKGGTV